MEGQAFISPCDSINSNLACGNDPCTSQTLVHFTGISEVGREKEAVFGDASLLFEESRANYEKNIQAAGR